MRRITIAIVAVLVVAAGVTPAAASSKSHEKTDILGQGGSTPVAEQNGAKLVRSDDRVVISFRTHTPRPGTYQYPTQDMVPPGATHPPVIQADEPDFRWSRWKSAQGSVFEFLEHDWSGGGLGSHCYPGVSANGWLR